MPSQPPVDRRNNSRELTEAQIQEKIAKHDAERRRVRMQTRAGLAVGVVGLAVGGFAGLATQNIWMAVLGFTMALIGFGFTSPKEAADMVRGILGRNSKKD